eukprot:gene3622-4058_t
MRLLAQLAAERKLVIDVFRCAANTLASAFGEGLLPSGNSTRPWGGLGLPQRFPAGEKFYPNGADSTVWHLLCIAGALLPSTPDPASFYAALFPSAVTVVCAHEPASSSSRPGLCPLEAALSVLSVYGVPDSYSADRPRALVGLTSVPVPPSWSSISSLPPSHPSSSVLSDLSSGLRQRLVAALDKSFTMYPALPDICPPFAADEGWPGRDHPRRSSTTITGSGHGIWLHEEWAKEPGMFSGSSAWTLNPDGTWTQRAHLHYALHMPLPHVVSQRSNEYSKMRIAWSKWTRWGPAKDTNALPMLSALARFARAPQGLSVVAQADIITELSRWWAAIPKGRHPTGGPAGRLVDAPSRWWHLCWQETLGL